MIFAFVDRNFLIFPLNEFSDKDQTIITHLVPCTLSFFVTLPNNKKAKSERQRQQKKNFCFQKGDVRSFLCNDKNRREVN